MALSPADVSGRLILLYGPPGTGKTTALRTLAREWSGWCQVDCVLDPERLFAEPGYLLDVAVGDEDPHPRTGGRRWRLLILEDCDELIRAKREDIVGPSPIPAAQSNRRPARTRSRCTRRDHHERGRWTTASSCRAAGQMPGTDLRWSALASRGERLAWRIGDGREGGSDACRAVRASLPAGTDSKWSGPGKRRAVPVSAGQAASPYV